MTSRAGMETLPHMMSRMKVRMIPSERRMRSKAGRLFIGLTEHVYLSAKVREECLSKQASSFRPPRSKALLRASVHPSCPQRIGLASKTYMFGGENVYVSDQVG